MDKKLVRGNRRSQTMAHDQPTDHDAHHHGQ